MTTTDDRKMILLRATYDMLKKQVESHYVLNILETTACWDGEECDSYCLMAEIEDLLGDTK
jgi:LytS/YehU family sensor histidine kinase